MSSSLEVITGPMYSGKTEELIRRLKRVSIAGLKALVLRPDLDTKRYMDIQTHDGSFALTSYTNFKPLVVSRDLKEMAEIWELVEGCDVLAIEEAQFFKPEVCGFVDRALLMDKKRIICAGLDMDCKGCPFGQMPWLLAKATTVTKLTAVCSGCSLETATRTQAKVEIQGSVSEAVGGVEMYEARCLDCWALPLLGSQQ